MKRKLITVGCGWGIYMPKSILQLMQIEPKTARVLFEVDENVLKITKFDKKFSNTKNMLVKKFITSGHGYGIYTTLTILQLLNINPEVDEIEYRVKGQVLEIRKAI